MRMIQLRMHLKGEAERAISGLGTKGIMYSTALKSLKKQFGQPSFIVRAEGSQETKEKLSKNYHRTSSTIQQSCIISTKVQMLTPMKTCEES